MVLLLIFIYYRGFLLSLNHCIFEDNIQSHNFAVFYCILCRYILREHTYIFTFISQYNHHHMNNYTKTMEKIHWCTSMTIKSPSHNRSHAYTHKHMHTRRPIVMDEIQSLTSLLINNDDGNHTLQQYRTFMYLYIHIYIYIFECMRVWTIPKKEK